MGAFKSPRDLLRPAPCCGGLSDAGEMGDARDVGDVGDADEMGDARDMGDVDTGDGVGAAEDRLSGLPRGGV